MDRYRSPQLQSLNAAALQIGTPRALRPQARNEERTPARTAHSHVPLAYTPVVPTQMLSEPSESSFDSSAGPRPQIYTPGPRLTDFPNDAHDRIQARSGFIGGIVHGLRRIPRAMEKHHSRQSLHEEYMAEAQAAAAARYSQMSPDQGEHSQSPKSMEFVLI